MDRLTKEQRTRVMRSIKSSGSKIETLLQKALWHKGYRYRKNCAAIYGKPDIAFRKYKLAIFCDSEFWHGKDWKEQKKTIHSHKKFWIEKIETNIKRDRKVTRYLHENGWKVMRFWGRDIEKNLEECVNQIERYIRAYKKTN